MKYVIVLLLGSLLLGSCSQDIQDNSPAFQGLVDSLFFRGNNNSAVVNPDGSIAIRGRNVVGEVQVVVSSLDQTTVTLGAGASSGNIASYINGSGTLFSTNSDEASGEVSIIINGDNTVSGTLNFVALTDDGTESVSFSRGAIFEVPILNEFDQNDFPMTGGGIEPEPDSFTARVNTMSYVPESITSSASGAVLLLNGSASDMAISLTMPEDIVPGTYDITEGGVYSALYTTIDGSFNATEGTLIIESNDTTERRITGDFIFNTLNEDFVITDGAFSISY